MEKDNLKPNKLEQLQSDFNEILLVKDDDPSFVELSTFEQFYAKYKGYPIEKKDASALLKQLFAPLDNGYFLIVDGYRFALIIENVYDFHSDTTLTKCYYPNVEETIHYYCSPSDLHCIQLIELINRNMDEVV